ncbi:MAG: hypothetical protein WAO98_08635 [Alphaproteobacteria bacterium]
MTTAKEAYRVSWLMAAWSDQRRKIASLLARLGDLGTPGGMTPKIFHKFLHMLSQVAAEKEHEMHLIDEIEAIERKHRFMRKVGWLKRIGPKPIAPEYEKTEKCEWDDERKPVEQLREAAYRDGFDSDNACYSPPAARPKEGKLGWLLLFAYMFSRR